MVVQPHRLAVGAIVAWARWPRSRSQCRLRPAGPGLARRRRQRDGSPACWPAAWQQRPDGQDADEGGELDEDKTRGSYLLFTVQLPLHQGIADRISVLLQKYSLGRTYVILENPQS